MGIVGINKMDNTSPTPYLQSRFDEIAGEVVVMLKTAGYKEDKIKKEFPFVPISGWEGDNLVKKTEKMPWYKGCDLTIDGASIHVDTLKDCFNDACFPPKRTDDAAMPPASRACTRLRVSVVSSPAVSSRAPSLRSPRSSSLRPTERCLAVARCSPSRCTTSRSTRPWLVTTSVSTSRV